MITSNLRCKINRKTAMANTTTQNCIIIKPENESMHIIEYILLLWTYYNN